MGFRYGHPRQGHDANVRAAKAAKALGAIGIALLVVVAEPKEAAACGACYSNASESTVVNDHNMALAISKQQTILWDQIQYQGNPKDFAYVIPAKPGTRLEPSNDSWFQALDTSTRPIIMSPPQSGGGGYGGGGGDGCGCGAMSADALSAAGADRSNSGESVKVVEQAVVGPYETVTLRSTDPQALSAWLTDHGYAIPPTSIPIIDQYVADGYDFIAMRLQPSKDVRSMEPIRIVSPGSDPALPMRMMQIGAGAKLGITLYVIGEGRYQPSNFVKAEVDFKKLIWDSAQNRSNYQELSNRAMETGEGKGIIVEYAQKPDLNPNGFRPVAGQMANTGLAVGYKTACEAKQNANPTPATDASSPTKDAATDATSDAAVSDGGDEAGADASTTDAGQEEDAGPIVRTTKCDDLDVALDGLNRPDVWVTRMRMNLPNAALVETLRLEPAAQQVPLDNIHQTTEFGSVTTARIARTNAPRWAGSAALAAATIYAVTRIIRRRKR